MSATDNLKSLQIEANLIADRMLCLFDVRANVQDGVAYLSGEVETGEQKNVAEQLAYRVADLFDVVNEIDVVPGRLQTALRCTLHEDGLVCEEIPREREESSAQLQLKARLGAMFSSVRVKINPSHCSIVFVEGNVSTEDEKTRLLKEILRTEGIDGIESSIKIIGI